MRITKEQKILVLLYTANGTVKVTLRNYVKKASKIGGLSRLPNYLNDSEKKLVFNSIVKSQLSYCRLVQMFCSRNLQQYDKVHERALRVVLNDHTSDFKTLLQRNNDVYNHHKNIQNLLIEIFQTKRWSCSSDYGISIFQFRNVKLSFSAIMVTPARTPETN